MTENIEMFGGAQQRRLTRCPHCGSEILPMLGALTCTGCDFRVRDVPVSVEPSATEARDKVKDIVAATVRVRNMVPLAHLADPATAIEAAARVAEYSDNQATAVLFTLLGFPDGLTYDELEVYLDMRSAKQRLSDLKAHGLVVGTGETRDTRWGAPAEIYAVSADARLAIFHERMAP